MPSKVLVWNEQREEDVSKIGLAIHEAIVFKKVHVDLIRLLSTGATDQNICSILDINFDLLEKFKPRIRRKVKQVNINLGLPTGDRELSKARSFWEFVEETTGDLDLLGWQSFYSCLDLVHDETEATLHSVDKSFAVSRASHASGRGVFLIRADLIRLLRLNFKRKYKVDIVNYVNEHKLDIFRIDCKQVDKTTLLPKTPWIKGQALRPRVIHFIQVRVLEDSWRDVVTARQTSAQVERDKFIELTDEDVLMPPYE